MNERDRPLRSRREFWAAAARWVAFAALTGGSAALVARNRPTAARCARFGADWSAARCGDCPAAARCPTGGATVVSGSSPPKRNSAETSISAADRRESQP